MENYIDHVEIAKEQFYRTIDKMGEKKFMYSYSFTLKNGETEKIMVAQKRKHHESLLESLKREAGNNGVSLILENESKTLSIEVSYIKAYSAEVLYEFED